MCHRLIPVAVIAVILSGSIAQAQCGCNASPAYAPVATSYVAGYAPAAVYEAPVSYTANYAPPVAYEVPVAYTANYAPAVAYQAPVAYAPPMLPQSLTRDALCHLLCAGYGLRDLLHAVHDLFARRSTVRGLLRGAGHEHLEPRVYVPGEPVRNTLRALTP